MVSAFSAANGVVLSQMKTAEKSNEITTIPELLKLLNLQGCLFTIDVMRFPCKDNQPKLVKVFEQALPMSELINFEGDAYVTDEKIAAAKKRITTL
jgi:predicted transposase YbfD/YdcC